MKFLLDTNAWIGHLRQKSPTVSYRLGQHPASDVILCSVVLAELVYGAERSGPAHRAANFALIAQLRQQYLCLPFDDPAAEEYGRIRSHLANQGTSPPGPCVTPGPCAWQVPTHRLRSLTYSPLTFFFSAPHTSRSPARPNSREAVRPGNGLNR